MAKPELVARCVAAMCAAVSIPVTVKHRLGIDDQDPWPTVSNFVRTIADAGCEHFIVHARKAWLAGLSPKENREVPPLMYDLVYQLKAEFPDLCIGINGGITTLDEAEAHLARVDGVMLGRAAYQDPYVLAEVDRRLFGEGEVPPDRFEIVERLLPYIEREVAAGAPLKSITRHILGLFNGQRGARAWRRHLSEHAPRFDGSPRAAVALVKEAAAFVAGERLPMAAE